MELPELTKEEFGVAISDGVRAALTQVLERRYSYGGDPYDEFMEAVQNGVKEAVWQMISHNTPQPGTAFYNHVFRAVEQAIENMDLPFEVTGRQP